jgi:oxygen-independent coproporphyrinogen-3 oxidase
MVDHLAEPHGIDLPEPTEGNLFVSAYPPFSCWSEQGTAAADSALQSESASPSEIPLGIYVHTPFCLERCHYCYYRSFADPTRETIDRYLDALISELKLYAQSPAVAGRYPTFIYFGGGTPSLLSAEQIQRLISEFKATFSWDNVEEVTFECAPQTVTQDRLEIMRASGVTRVSMGVQQLNDDVLKSNGRVHLVRDVERAYTALRKTGFDIVNFDLIVGLVEETDNTFYGSLDQVIDMGPDSVTLYQLEIPVNTPLYRDLRDGKIDTPPAGWDVKRGRLKAAFAQLEQAGYTIRSAYAAVCDPDRHRFLYQDLQYQGADLLGMGVASFSYFGGVHYQNVASLRGYCESLAGGQSPSRRVYAFDDSERLVREFVLQLKLGSLKVDYFRDKFSVDVLVQFAEPLARFAEGGWLDYSVEEITLTREGLLLVDRLLRAFYSPEHRDVAYW